MDDTLFNLFDSMVIKEFGEDYLKELKSNDFAYNLLVIMACCEIIRGVCKEFSLWKK